MVGDRIGVGIVGLTPGNSWAATAHVPALRALPAYEIAAVSSSSLASATSAAAAFAIPRAFGDPASLAADPSVDLVAITVKVPHHHVLVSAALDAGKMVYCEWPLGNGLQEAVALAERAQALGIRTIVGLQARASPVIRYVRDLVHDGYLGQILSTTLVGSGGAWGPSISARNQYLYDRRNGATLLSIPFGHTVDALCSCLGEFREVSATLATRRDSFVVVETQQEFPMAVDDQVIVNGILESDVTVAIHYRGGTCRGTNLRWEINGTEGDLEVTAPSGHAQMSELTLRGGRNGDVALSELAIPARYRLTPPEISGQAVNVAEVYAEFAKGDAAPYPVADFAAAVIRHRLLDAIERSAVSGRRVTL